jgi:sulfotransferase
MKAVHFISGLPRSGSTLLAAILRQNPRFHAGISSPLNGIFTAAMGAMSARSEFAMSVDVAQREAVLRGLFQNFYQNKEAAVIFDTSRMWCSQVSAIARLLPNARLICCVRNASQIIDSIERLVQANPLEMSRMFHGPGAHLGAGAGNLYLRADILMEKGGMIRGSLDSLREAYYGEHADRILVVQYESLARNPSTTLEVIYDFIDEDPFKHYFDNVEFSADDFDLFMGMPGLHHVKRKVEFRERRMTIPPDLVAKFDVEFWRDPKKNLRNVRVV